MEQQPPQNLSVQLNNQATHLPEATSHEHETHHHIKNIYPTMRHLILVMFVLIALFIILFLMHQNGKSIYEHGI